MAQDVFFVNIREKIIEHLQDCKFDLKIAVAWFTDKTLIKEVNRLIGNGVQVEIIIYDDHVNQKELFKDLYYNKAKISLSKRLMHNKFCVIDKKTVINGSYNWTINASNNDENIQIVYNDIKFANKFVLQFRKLASNCRYIDNHFEYSLSSLEELNDEYENFLLNWPNYKYPYLLNTINLNPSPENISTKIFGYVYLIKNADEEKEFLWYYYFLKTKYSVKKLLQIKKQKINLPQHFDFIYHFNFDYNNVWQFSNIQQQLVEEHKISNYSSARNRFYLYLINNKGEPISEKFRFTYKVSNELYIMHHSSVHSGLKPYFINRHLEKTNIPYYVMKVLPKYGMIVSNYDRLKSDIGILDFKNKIVIPFEFDNWVREYKDEDEYLDLIEYPVFICNPTKDSFYNPRIDYNNFHNYDHMLHRFNLKNYSLIEKFKINGTEKNDNSIYLFKSDFNYKYKEFYTIISEFEFDTTNLTRIVASLSLKEFNELKLHFNNDNKLKELFDKFQKYREKLQAEKEAEAKKKEGCYIATMVYEHYDHPSVLELRLFRDMTLKRNTFGRKFIELYYKYSPVFVNYVKDKNLLKASAAIIIKVIVRVVNLWNILINR